MGYQRTLALSAKGLQGFKYIERVGKLLDKRRPVGTQRDRAGHRRVLFDQYVALRLMYFFNPALHPSEAIAWKRLMPSLAIIFAGLMLVNANELAHLDTQSVPANH